MLRRRRLPPPAASAVYELTEWGLSSSRCSRRSAAGPRGRCPPSDHIGVDSLVLSLRTLFAPERAAGRDAHAAARSSTTSRSACGSPQGALDITRGEVPDADATVRCSPEAFAGVVHLGVPIDDPWPTGR